MNQTNKEIENSQKDIKSGYLGEEGDDVLVYTTNQTNNRIREEWLRKLRDNFAPHEIPPTWDENNEITYPLLENFIDELLKSQRDSLVGKIEKYIQEEIGKGTWNADSIGKELLEIIDYK